MKIFQRGALSTLLAFTGMTYELIYSQWLSAILGGTLFRYSVTIGLFTFCLGLSAIAFDYFENRWLKFLSLKWINLFIIIVGSFSFIIYDYVFYLSEKKIDNYFLTTIILHIPIVLIALATGLELPILYHKLQESEKLKVLSFDYVGMFIATILFPLLLLPQFGIKVTLILNLFLQLFCFLPIKYYKGRDH
jgi:spermidine synthase